MPEMDWIYNRNATPPPGWRWDVMLGQWVPATPGEGGGEYTPPGGVVPTVPGGMEGGVWYEGMGLEEMAAAAGVSLDMYSSMDQFLMDMLRLGQEGSQELYDMWQTEQAAGEDWVAQQEAWRAEDEARRLAYRAEEQERQWVFDLMTAQGRGLEQLQMAMPNYFAGDIQAALLDWMQQLSTGYEAPWPGVTEEGVPQIPPIEDFIAYMYGRGVPEWM